MFTEIVIEGERKEQPKNLHTDVFWLLSLLGISFTPLDFSSICFLTTERFKTKQRERFS